MTELSSGDGYNLGGGELAAKLGPRGARKFWLLELAPRSWSYPSAEGRLPKGLSFGESDVIDDEVRARSVHKVGNGHKFDGASAASLVA
ncbi:MAG: hypothetical protein WBE14_00880 [Xanthobacteraceae bacterium]